ncbi:MAG: flagellin [Defluviitaleaceae bacterium]|nr:flagellin [Defluviitaleaceae bacterium]
MRIANNIPALLTHISLRQNDRHMTASMNRLATGLRINSARDDAAGMSIANKLSFQLVGLERSSDNSSHGVSLVQTAEGALNEVHAMLQRMRELAVQAANDTNVAEDRMAIQNEINALTDEITALARRSEFNTIGLLNGEASRVTTNWVTNAAGNMELTRVIANAMFVTEGTPAGTLRYTITSLGEPARMTGAAAINWNATAPTSGRISVNGIDIDVVEGSTASRVWEQIVQASEYAGVVPTMPVGTNPLEISSMRFGSHEEVRLTGNASIWAMFGLSSGATSGQDVQIEVQGLYDVGGNPVHDFNNSLAVSFEGNRATLTSLQGHSIQLSIFVPDGHMGIAVPLTAPLEMELRIEEFGGLRVQIGPNFNMFMDIQIPRVSAETLGLTEYRAGQQTRLLQFTTLEGATRAIDQTSNAIAMISNIRSRLGAYQNRLEHTINNLDNAANNTESARSRVQDTDMAREMTLMTQRQVLYQAGLSILGQANQRPQMILQLLQ